MNNIKTKTKAIVNHGYFRYFSKKLVWFILTLIVAVILNFILPRLMPGDPVTALMGRILAGGGVEHDVVARTYARYTELFGTDRPMIEQFFIYVRNMMTGNFGQSFSQFPREISDILANALPWTLALQIPAIIVGWLLGNLLGALAAYIRKGFDKVLIPVSLFVSGLPAFGLGIILLSIFAINLGWFPIGGGYGGTLIPALNWEFVRSVIYHYQLPFWTVVFIAIGGQAIGMRSMSIYELNADYVKYARYMGIKDRKIVRYVFRNAMLPQVTGLALQFGTMIGGSLVAEIIFSYPGLGTTLLTGIMQNDYALISATTLITTLMVLTVVFLLDILYGFIDPRVKAALVE